MKTIEIVFCMILGVTFIYASIHKIANPAEFAKIIYGYDIFPNASVNILAITVPFFELFTGILLLGRIFLFRPALIIMNLMLMGFIIIIGFNLIRGHQFDCGCFSFAGSQDGVKAAVSLLIRDVALLACGVFLWFQTGRPMIRSDQG